MKFENIRKLEIRNIKLQVLKEMIKIKLTILYIKIRDHYWYIKGLFKAILSIRVVYRDHLELTKRIAARESIDPDKLREYIQTNTTI